ncbi:MAG: hypothetical protein AAF926_05520 [Pseudomonadota bacterium]
MRKLIMKPDAATPADYLRQSLNLVLAPAMWVLSSIGFFMPNARTAGEFSNLSDNLLVPLGPAFSIWFPIFVGCIGYGIIQALPANRTRAVFRQVGWWTAAGFAFICGWALITAYVPDAWVQWGTALIFIPAVAALNIATIRFTRQVNAVTGLERLFTWVPVSLIAGWCSLAIFLNWTPIAYDLFADGAANLLSSLLMLAAALGLIVWICRAAACNKVYVIPPIWGLSWLAVRQLWLEQDVPVIGIVSLIGILLLIATALWRPQSAISSDA